MFIKIGECVSEISEIICTPKDWSDIDPATVAKSPCHPCASSESYLPSSLCRRPSFIQEPASLGVRDGPQVRLGWYSSVMYCLYVGITRKATNLKRNTSIYKYHISVWPSAQFFLGIKDTHLKIQVVCSWGTHPCLKKFWPKVLDGYLQSMVMHKQQIRDFKVAWVYSKPCVCLKNHGSWLIKQKARLLGALNHLQIVRTSSTACLTSNCLRCLRIEAQKKNRSQISIYHWMLEKISGWKFREQPSHWSSFVFETQITLHLLQRVVSPTARRFYCQKSGTLQMTLVESKCSCFGIAILTIVESPDQSEWLLSVSKSSSARQTIASLRSRQVARQLRSCDLCRDWGSQKSWTDDLVLYTDTSLLYQWLPIFETYQAIKPKVSVLPRSDGTSSQCVHLCATSTRWSPPRMFNGGWALRSTETFPKFGVFWVKLWVY